jgi:hypothetical protein
MTVSPESAAPAPEPAAPTREQPSLIREVGRRVRYLRVGLAVSGVLLLAAVGVGWAVEGSAGAVGAALGVLLVATSYTVSMLAIAWADAINPRMVLSVGLGMYIIKFSLFGVMMIALADSAWPGLVPMAMGIVAGVVAWTGTQIWWTVRVDRANRTLVS